MSFDWSKESQRASRQTFFQGRLDKKLEAQKIKLRNNLIRNSGTPEDILIIDKKLGDDQDTASEVLKAHIVSNIIFPPLKDIPIDLVTKEYEDGYVLTNIISSYGKGKPEGNDQQKDLSTITIQLPTDCKITRDDRIVKVFVSGESLSSVMVFDVIDLMGTFSNNAALAISAKIALTADPPDLNKKVYQMCKTLAERRIKAGY